VADLSDAHLNLVVLSGFATRDPVLRHKTSGQVKAEFSFEVNRPFYRATGESVSDLFLVDAWEDIGEWAIENIKAGDTLIIVGTLNKESYSTRSGREHLTIVKAKYIARLDYAKFSDRVDTEAIKADQWDQALVMSLVDLASDMLGDIDEEDDADGQAFGASF